MNDRINVNFQGKEIEIPYRIYDIAPPEFFISLLPNQIKIEKYCQFTRHHNGHIREKFLLKLIECNAKIAIPYLILLASEYVFEITKIIFDNISNFNQKDLTEFALANPKFMKKSKDRMISYWDCYYRAVFPKLKNYDGYKLFELIEKLCKIPL